MSCPAAATTRPAAYDVGCRLISFHAQDLSATSHMEERDRQTDREEVREMRTTDDGVAVENKETKGRRLTVDEERSKEKGMEKDWFTMGKQ